MPATATVSASRTPIRFGTDFHTMRYTLKAHVGVFWLGPTITLGTFRWHWLAYLYAQAYLLAYPYRSVSVHLAPVEGGATAVA